MPAIRGTEHQKHLASSKTNRLPSLSVEMVCTQPVALRQQHQVVSKLRSSFYRKSLSRRDVGSLIHVNVLGIKYCRP